VIDEGRRLFWSRRQIAAALDRRGIRSFTGLKLTPNNLSQLEYSAIYPAQHTKSKLYLELAPDQRRHRRAARPSTDHSAAVWPGAPRRP
jgi:hypothetical protein